MLDANKDGYAGPTGLMTSMYVGKYGDDSGVLSTDDCDDSDAYLRSGVRGAMDSAAN